MDRFVFDRLVGMSKSKRDELFQQLGFSDAR